MYSSLTCTSFFFWGGGGGVPPKKTRICLTCFFFLGGGGGSKTKKHIQKQRKTTTGPTPKPTTHPCREVWPCHVPRGDLASPESPALPPPAARGTTSSKSRRPGLGSKLGCCNDSLQKVSFTFGGLVENTIMFQPKSHKKSPDPTQSNPAVKENGARPHPLQPSTVRLQKRAPNHRPVAPTIKIRQGAHFLTTRRLPPRK